MTAIAHSGVAIRNAWHPEPRHHMVITDRGNVNVWAGEVRGQLNTSEYIDI